ncbi:MAG: hypothetical protein JSV88_32905 [Candidatus Aminicenantes bacterium]|nr:MAG: hypothetical protein JSV88_32905 [Candidatus Aminicenantes bacterium]
MEDSKVIGKFINIKIRNTHFLLVFLFLIVFNTVPLKAQNVGDFWELVYYEPGLPFRSMTNNGSLFVVVGDDGLIFTSSDGKNWTKRAAGTTKNLYGAGYGNGLFVAAGYGGTILTSPDGITWTQRDSKLTAGLWGVAYGNSTYVVVGLNGNIATSPDGINWTKQNPGTIKPFKEVCYGNGLFVAVGNTGAIFTSPDGITWNNRSVGGLENLYSVGYFNSLYVCGGGAGTVFTSTNGTNWTKRNTNVGNYCWQITYCDGNYWFACSKTKSDPNNAPVLKSSDGITWNKIYTGSTSTLRAISAIGQKLAAAGDRRTIVYSDNTPVPDLTVFYPNGGETLNVGSSKTISWKASGPANVKIEYSTNAGSSWKEIIASTANDGAYSWTIPEDPSTQCRVKVSDAADGTPSDTSNTNFTIKAVSSTNTITIKSPNGGETWQAGSTRNITWKGSITYSKIDIEYYNGTNWNIIMNGTADDGVYEWTVPNVSTTKARIWIKGYDGISNPTDYSDDTFTISGDGLPPSITIIAPTGGDILTGGTNYSIKWTGYTNFSKIDIEYYDGSKWNVIVNGTADDGIHSWSVPNISTTKARIWIKGYDGVSNPTDYSDNFTISPPASGSITITSPNGGEVWARNSTENITWTSSGQVGNVKISYSTDGGINDWNTIVSSTANDGVHAWTLPDIISDNCLVKINDLADSRISDISNNEFSIGGPPQIVLNRDRFNFGHVRNGTFSCPQTLFISNGGGGTFDWTAEADASWINLSPTTGAGGGSVTVSIDPGGLGAGTYTGTITVSAPGVDNSPQTVDVYLQVINSSQENPPFGQFATPEDGITGVSGSIGVTGWVLDDTCVESVKISREVNGGLYYIGDAVFVEGARPDVEQAYPDYPNNYKAGWGYMMLTNFLPDGQLILKAIARDSSGHQVELGTKTIFVDNANAVKPFGAIDTPEQGGDASGTSFRNNGWALTPQPNKIPENGSTINVYIDGEAVGKATYNLYREDIASLFPGYANTDGAWGYLDFNTTAYSNGVHTISWGVSDNAGNSDGIGSRYFTIQNTGGASSSSARDTQYPEHVYRQPSFLPTSGITPDYSNAEPIRIKTGYNDNINPREIYPDNDGIITIEIRELQRIMILLPGHAVGCMMVNGEPRPLPIGSKIDPETGIFYWQLGPGFLGEYYLVFIARDPNGTFKRNDIRLRILPGVKK